MAMKKIFLLFLFIVNLMATESFYGITLGTTLTNDFAPALNEKRGDFEYRKSLENDSFQYIFAKD
ncbi:MAG: hypothetical protein LRY52_11215 [Sulfurospirillum cavolei]|nr:hypothetical protein [Sulfurospirillum cavolei]